MDLLNQYFLVCFIAILGSVVQESYGQQSFQDFMRLLFRKQPQSLKQDPPTKGKPTEVRLGLYINSLDINTIDQTMGFHAYLRMAWNDPRLAFDPANISDGSKDEYRSYDWDKIWIPDIFIRNARSFENKKSNGENILFKLKSNGDVWFVQKVAILLSCPMKLNKFPNDAQSCPIMFESFGYTMDNLYLSWIDNPVDIDPSIHVPEFTLDNAILYDCSQNYTAGAFPCLEIRFVIQRDSGYHVKYMYLPSCGIVMLAWLLLFVDGTKFGMRLVIASLLALMLGGVNRSAMQNIPPVSYIMNGDVWAIMCMLFLISVLVESLVVKIQTSRNEEKGRSASGVARKEFIFKLIYPIVFILFAIIFFAVSFS